jgi:hypothetical protein
MVDDIESAIRYRNYAEELRIMASDFVTPENRETLRKLANNFEQIAASYEAIDSSKRLAGLR